jgi:hypothetical protein
MKKTPTNGKKTLMDIMKGLHTNQKIKINDKNIIKIIHNRDANRDVREIPLDNLFFIIT